VNYHDSKQTMGVHHSSKMPALSSLLFSYSYSITVLAANVQCSCQVAKCHRLGTEYVLTVTFLCRCQMDFKGTLHANSEHTPGVGATPSGTESGERSPVLSSREGLVLFQSSGTRKKSTATRQMDQARGLVFDLMSVLNEASARREDEEEVHMDDANVVFGHQQEGGEPAGEEYSLVSASPLQEVDRCRGHVGKNYNLSNRRKSPVHHVLG